MELKEMQMLIIRLINLRNKLINYVKSTRKIKYMNFRDYDRILMKSRFTVTYLEAATNLRHWIVEEAVGQEELLLLAEELIKDIEMSPISSLRFGLPQGKSFTPLESTLDAFLRGRGFTTPKTDSIEDLYPPQWSCLYEKA